MPTRHCRVPTQAAPLAGDDLGRLATSAYMLGRDDEAMRHLERAHHWYAEHASLCRPYGARSGSA